MSAPLKLPEPEPFQHQPQLDTITGTLFGGQAHLIAKALADGGSGKADVLAKIAAILPAETRHGTPNPISQRVNAVLTQMKKRGWTIEETWVLVPPPAPKTLVEVFAEEAPAPVVPVEAPRKPSKATKPKGKVTTAKKVKAPVRTPPGNRKIVKKKIIKKT